MRRSSLSLSWTFHRPPDALRFLEMDPYAKTALSSGNDVVFFERYHVVNCRRAEGSNLYLDEFSADSDLSQSSVCIVFSQSMIIPGTQLLSCRGTLALVVPTQCAIHRFFIHAWQDNLTVGGTSMLPTDCTSNEPSI